MPHPPPARSPELLTAPTRNGEERPPTSVSSDPSSAHKGPLRGPPAAARRLAPSSSQAPLFTPPDAEVDVDGDTEPIVGTVMYDGNGAGGLPSGVHTPAPSGVRQPSLPPYYGFGDDSESVGLTPAPDMGAHRR